MAQGGIKRKVDLPTVGEVVVEAAPGLKNWRTLIVNGAMVVAGAGGVPFVDWLAGIDWTQYVSPRTAVWFAFFTPIVINVIMRFLTKGPVGSDVIVKKVDPIE